MAEHFVQINVTAPRAGRLTYNAPSEASIENIQLTEIKEENVLLKTLYSGISRGTESLVYHGRVPKSEWKRMQCPFMSGNFSFPVSYGYACVCEIIDKGASVNGLEKGDRVFVLHPHQDLFQVPSEHCNLLSEAIPTARGVLAANMETALNAIWDAEISNEASCAVIGAGVVGLSTAHALREVAGLSPVIIDVNPTKEKIASSMGFHFETGTERTDSDSKAEYDLIFHTSASAAGLQSAVELAGFEAKIIEMSWYGEKPVTLSLGGKFHSSRLKIISSQVGTIAPAKRHQFSYSQRMQKAIALLDDPRLDNLLEKPIGFHNLPNHLHDIFNPQSDVLCQLIEYTE